MEYAGLFEGFGFLRPALLLAGLPALLAVAMAWRGILPEFHWPLAGLLGKSAGRRSFFRHFRFFLLAILVLAFSLLAGGLYKGEVTHTTLEKAYTIVITQDRSGSMDGLLDALGKVTAFFFNLRKGDKFCGVYFSNTAVRTACGESAKAIAKISNEEIKGAVGSGSTSMGLGTEFGAGILMALTAILEEANIFTKLERDEILHSLGEERRVPQIPPDKRNSHEGFIVVVESDAEFSAYERIDAVQVLRVMAELGIRNYFLVFTAKRNEPIIQAVKRTGGDSHWLDPKATSDASVLRAELENIFKDIDTLNPKETSTIEGVSPRTFPRQIGLAVIIISLTYTAVFLLEESWPILALKKRGER